ncbi:MFS general substrate transporter [Gymnopus androsaceus JB14]|uniref:MFS general substrate transporter n=1 Tax=Gymnopus androsaceus JB14 TaxID=1447944 RepID=A0A6A4I475_9AGAR|nr:MFS general substrate transporter [Gymnopus androsaceus JB14]
MELYVLSNATGVSAQSLSRLRTAEQFDNPKGDDSIAEVPIGAPVQQNTEASMPEPIPASEEAGRSQHRTREYIQLAALYWCLFLAGWNDGSTGPLLPRIQEVSDILSFLFIFVFACVVRPSLPSPSTHSQDAELDAKGFISGACFNVPLSREAWLWEDSGHRLPMSCKPRNYHSLYSYCRLQSMDFGSALEDAQSNGFVASLKTHSETKMGLLHASYGFGALCAPLVATQSLYSDSRAKTNVLLKLDRNQAKKGTSERSQFRQILSLKTVHLLAVFILVYVGVEVTVGGWIVTFIQTVRGGGANSGYISAGFFGGLMLGRIILLWVNQKIGERRVLYLYAGLAIGLEIVIWLVPSLIGDGVAISIIGILLGPMYPLTMNHTGRVLPRWLVTGSIGWIAGFGAAGSALFPFLTGALASKFGIKSLQPLLVSMMAFMTILWAILPGAPRKAD